MTGNPFEVRRHRQFLACPVAKHQSLRFVESRRRSPVYTTVCQHVRSLVERDRVKKGEMNMSNFTIFRRRTKGCRLECGVGSRINRLLHSGRRISPCTTGATKKKMVVSSNQNVPKSQVFAGHFFSSDSPIGTTTRRNVSLRMVRIQDDIRIGELSIELVVICDCNLDSDKRFAQRAVTIVQGVVEAC